MSIDVIGDEVITLSPLEPSDLDAHLAGEDEQIIRWLSGGRSSRESMLAYLENCVRWRAAGGPLLAFGIRVRPTGELAGTLDLWLDQPYLGPDEVNISYGLYPRWRGNGLATRAVLAACRHLSQHSSITMAVIRVDPRNTASAAVARRAGFRYDRHTHDDHGDLDWYLREVTAT